MLKSWHVLAAAFIVLMLMMPAFAESNDGNLLKVTMIFDPGSTLDPAYKYTGWYVREAGIYETLFAYDKDMNLIPELASGFSQINDTAYTIHLRTGVKFHDGTPFNADSVVYSLGRVLASSNTRHNEYSFIQSVTKSDDNNVMITTKEPYSPLIASLSDPLTSMVKPGIDFNKTAIGTGPFMFDSYEKSVKLTVKKNENYWGGMPKLDGAVINYVSDPTTRALQIEGKESQIVLSVPPSEVKTINADPNLQVINKNTLRTYFMYVNMRKGPLDNLKIRQALNYAINKQEIVDSALEGIGGTPATGIFPSVSSWSANDKLNGYEFDQTKAKELLKEAGISDTNGDGKLRYSNGDPFSITIKTYTSRPELKPSAELVAAQLQAIGIQAKVVIEESGALSADLKSGNYDLALYAWNTLPTGDPDYFVSKHFKTGGSDASLSGYSNTQVDSWIQKARETFDTDQRKDYYTKIQEQVLVDSPEINLFYLNYLIGENKAVKGFEIYPNEYTVLTKDISL